MLVVNYVFDEDDLIIVLITFSRLSSYHAHQWKETSELETRLGWETLVFGPPVEAEVSF